MVEETAIGGPARGFQPTVWTAVLKAKDLASPERRLALEGLIGTYWKPVYTFIRKRGIDVEKSKDLTQSFFTAFLEKDILRNVAPEKGKFRTFLLTTLTYFLADEHDRASALKRGGGFRFIAGAQDLESRAATPDAAFFRQWAIETMSRAVARLREECSPEDFLLLSEGRDEGLSVSDRKNRLHRLRLRLKELLREIIRPTVELESEIDDEVRQLFSGGSQVL